MAVTTKVLTVGMMPADLTADPDIARELTARGRVNVAIQNTGIGKSVFYADQSAAPVAGSRDGLLLRYGDAVVYELVSGEPFWVWSTTTATLGITEAA